MELAIYSIERDIVDPVFFAVVPDSFMKRESDCCRPAPRQDWNGADWADEQDRPLISPNDRWSF